MAAPNKIIQLVERFTENITDYRQGRYNEMQTRREFIDPFFKILGWDIDNESGQSELNKDVIHEDAIKIERGTKAPDYCFRIGGVRKFFVEAKKPSIDIQGDTHPAYQLRRYGWSAKLPLSILTNFEEFAVYDCRIMPEKHDRAINARLWYLTYSDYIKQWEKIAQLFSRDAVQNGSLEKYAEEHKDKRGTIEVDVAFLQEIERWRELLAIQISRDNPQLTQRELNYAVQRTIDRIIFLRICEDRGIEPYGKLRHLRDQSDIYAILLKIFYNADDYYNSGLFHFKNERKQQEPPDELTPKLKIGDEVLKLILQKLYYPESPYAFSVIPTEILGQVYEQFLGKVISLNSNHQTIVEEKPEVKKAGGVYYTPGYIVDYIVQQTLGELLRAKTPQQIATISILDPACGSGSFLLGAYQYLLNWYLAQYITDDPKKWSKGKTPRLYLIGTEWKLTIEERKRILITHIFGVDIDVQAVEVTKLSLLLKVLEGENEQTINSQIILFQKRVLPNLANNIKCGNSLISSDFYTGNQRAFDEEELYKINAFDWNQEFSKIMKNGGFNIVIGNPPYVLLQGAFRDDDQTLYFRNNFHSASYKIDTYHLFIEKAIKLTCNSGFSAMITPANFLTNNYLKVLRRFILEHSMIEKIMIIDKGVFQRISVDNAIFVIRPGIISETFKIIHAKPENENLKESVEMIISVKSALNNEYVLFTGENEDTTNYIWVKIFRNSLKLGEIADVNFGKQLRNRKKFGADVISVDNVDQIQYPYKACYTGRDVSKYSIKWNKLACLDDEIARQGGCWDSDKHNAKDKLITRQIGVYPKFALDELGYQCLNTVFMINLHNSDFDPYFLLGVLNSKIIKAVWYNKFYDQRRTFPKIKGTYLKQLPIWKINFDKISEKINYDNIVKNVHNIIRLYKQLADTKTPQMATILRRQIKIIDNEIDKLVYELYGLTEEEIKIIELKIETKTPEADNE